jgi:hypothetical protein
MFLVFGGRFPVTSRCEPSIVSSTPARRSERHRFARSSRDTLDFGVQSELDLLIFKEASQPLGNILVLAMQWAIIAIDN